jgi:cold shock CspA family protein
MAAALHKGIVREFDTARGRGIIVTDQGACIQVRYSAIIGQGVRRLQCGDKVVFEIDQTGQTSRAIHVSRT